ncbi:MAG TPA: DUF1028 domain-containing protein [Thermoanaerobaculaceae bacterium]|nr:DUF1028 domain-containing protein [Thermoanaerobaculaceae bacterium]
MTPRSAVIALAAVAAASLAGAALGAPPRPATFSIVATDREAGEVGVAVASRFFAVGAVVPYARAGVGGVAAQANANTTWGPRGLDMLAEGATPAEALRVLIRTDDGNDARQAGIVSAAGDSVTFTGPGCTSWAGGRSGPGYAVQGNILTGEKVVAAMEAAFLASTRRPLAERLFAALKAGDAEGGDSRGRQSAAIVVCRAHAGFNGFSDRAVDVRVDDSPDPFREIARLLAMALVNDDWNRGWTAFTQKRFAEALAAQERAAARAESQPAMLPEVLYDLAVIRLANGDRPGAESALARAVGLNPKLAAQARADKDLAGLRTDTK